MTSSPEQKTCAICLGNLEAGQGQAIFTAECSHSFHFACIGNSVSHGNHMCPVCRANWNHLPSVVPNSNIRNQAPFHRRRNPIRSPQPQPHLPGPVFDPEPVQFSDDEPLPNVSSDPSSSPGLQKVRIKAVPERTAAAASESVSHFAVLVGLKAPSVPEDGAQMQRAPLDLVTVLDVSGSMSGSKLALLKRAMDFVVDNMGPSDRLSIVSFSTEAHRLLPLRRMTENGREDAKRAVNSLWADGWTNIVEGLKKGVRVLEERRERNPVASIIFLSDGMDTCHVNPRFGSSRNQGQPPSYLHLLPGSIRPVNRIDEVGETFPVHAFGFGTDHDPLAMHAIADGSGGTFSFIESYEMVQDAFASCLGGLLSVVTQELRLVVRSASHGVEIKSILSGRYTNEITDQESRGRLNIGDLYADEEKEFLVNVTVPIFQTDEGEENERKTSLLDITCTYRDVVSNETIQIDGDLVEIRRPNSLTPSDMIVDLEVDRQRNRLNAAESIAEAQRMAETGNLAGARSYLSKKRINLLATASAQAGDDVCMSLDAEMKETEDRMGNMRIYAARGRAFALSNMSSHGYQRATTMGSIAPQSAAVRFGGASLGAYATPMQAKMVSKSRSSDTKSDADSMQE